MVGALRERATNSDRQKECDQFADVAIARFEKWRVPTVNVSVLGIKSMSAEAKNAVCFSSRVLS